MRTYEGVFFLAETLDEETAPKAWDGVKEEITKLGGSVIEERFDGKRSFARPLGKKRGGHYGELKFGIEPDQVKVLSHRFKMSDQVLRAMIVQETNRPKPLTPEEAAAAEAATKAAIEAGIARRAAEAAAAAQE